MPCSLDISNHRKGIDIQQLKNEGLVHLYMKATEGMGYTDPCLEEFYNQALKIGVPIGYYHYITANPNVEGQAEDFYNAVKGKKADLKYAVDMEVNLNSASEVAQRFINKFESLIGKTGICCIYAGGVYARNNFTQEVKNKYPLWVAHYGVNKPMETGFKVLAGWQYSENEMHAGQPCDSNIFYAPIMLDYTINSETNSNQASPDTIYSYEQHGNARVIVDKLNVRVAPSVNAEIVASYDRGEVIYNYDRVFENDGYRWIRYVGSSGNYRYVAVRVLSTNEKYANCY